MTRLSDLEHDLETARAYQATYTDRPTDDPYVQLMRANNEAEIARLEAQIAGQPTEGTTP